MVTPSSDSLRQRKKLETRRHLGVVALRMFGELGFENVTVAAIARAAGVSTKTVFNYFPTKEDLVFADREEMDSDLIRAIRERSTGEGLLAAVRRHTLGLAERMHKVPAAQRAAFRGVLLATPTAQSRWREAMRKQEDVLTKVIREEITASSDDVSPAIVACVLIVLNRLAFSDLTGWPGGKRVTYAQTVRMIEQAFDLLENGLDGYGK